jgi:threonine dehydrogenase-like Zn-dependent dehydrogenase
VERRRGRSRGLSPPFEIARSGYRRHAQIGTDADGDHVLGGAPSFYGNLAVAGGPAPVRSYIDELLPDVMEGRIEPGRVFDRVVRLDEVPDGYRAMNDREAMKVMVRP